MYSSKSNIFNQFSTVSNHTPKGVALSVSVMAFALSACQQTNGNFPIFNTTQSSKPAASSKALVTKRTLSTNVIGEKVGNGPIRISLLVPSSAQGGAGQVGKQIANAAKLAVRDFSKGRFQLVIKNTAGQSAQASLTASQAVQEGSSLVLGPLFSAGVSAASAVTKPANIPMIGFTSDINRARPGVYLLSFAPNADIRRTLNYGLSLGANRVVALLPSDTYGTVAEKELRKVFDAAGGQIVSIARYKRDTNSMVAAARSVALNLANANALYIPDGGQVPRLMLQSLKKAGADLTGKQIMGSGQWESTDTSNRIFNGAVFAGADKQNFSTFARRYKSVYGATPSATAALGYDAVSLAAELIRRKPTAPFSVQAIQTRSGFNGVTGIFRFEKNGRLQRGLVINQVENGKRIIVSPAPSSFGGGGF